MTEPNVFALVDGKVVGVGRASHVELKLDKPVSSIELRVAPPPCELRIELNGMQAAQIARGLTAPPTLYGRPIFVSPHLPIPPGPRKRLQWKPWHRGECYARRVQKKYTKLYGMGEPTHFLVTPAAIFCSTEAYVKLQQRRVRDAIDVTSIYTDRFRNFA